MSYSNIILPFYLSTFLLFYFSTNNMEYTKNQLALRNGQDREEIWIAYRGIIYDVTESRMWRNGKHYEHWAGQDLTEELADAPHGEVVFGKWKVVGRLV
jgi:predicted heme/steroid binding protein